MNKNKKMTTETKALIAISAAFLILVAAANAVFYYHAGTLLLERQSGLAQDIALAESQKERAELSLQEAQAALLSKKISSQSAQEAWAKGWNLVDGTCSGSLCLFENVYDNGHSNILGITTIRGHYAQKEKSAWGETKTCDTLVFSGGRPEFYDRFSDMVDQGNTVNSKDDDGNLMLNLSLELLSASDQQKITSSTKDNPVDLTVFLHLPKETGAPACFSFFNILQVR